MTDRPPQSGGNVNLLTIEQTLLEEADEHLITRPGEPIVNITAFTARQKVSGYVGNQISHLMGGDEPALIWMLMPGLAASSFQPTL